MRFSVRRRHVCPGEERRILRKSAFWMSNVTEKRILRSRRDGQAHSETHRLGRVRLSVRSSSNRDLRTLAQAAPQAGGGLLKRICPVEPFSIVPRSLAGGLPHTSRAPRRNGKAHSARSGNRRVRLSVRRRLQSALFREGRGQGSFQLIESTPAPAERPVLARALCPRPSTLSSHGREHTRSQALLIMGVAHARLGAGLVHDG